MVSGPRDLKNRVRHQILRILVVGELRGMSFSDLMQNCATNRLRQVLLAPTIDVAGRTGQEPPKSTKTNENIEIKRNEVVSQ